MEGTEREKARLVWKTNIGSSEVENGGVCFGDVDPNLNSKRNKKDAYSQSIVTLCLQTPSVWPFCTIINTLVLSYSRQGAF